MIFNAFIITHIASSSVTHSRQTSINFSLVLLNPLIFFLQNLNFLSHLSQWLLAYETLPPLTNIVGLTPASQSFLPNMSIAFSCNSFSCISQYLEFLQVIYSQLIFLHCLNQSFNFYHRHFFSVHCCFYTTFRFIVIHTHICKYIWLS